MPVVSSAVSTLRRVPLFADLAEHELELLACRVVRRSFGRGAIVFSEGARCEGLYLVESGAVKVVKTSSQGREQLITLDRAGSALGEIPLFDGGPYPATAVAEANTELLFVPASDFHRTLQSNPDLALKILKTVARRYRYLMNLVERLSFSTVRSRLAAHLLDLACEQGNELRPGVEFHLRARNQELAAQIGTVRELISRTLGRFHEEGLIRMQGRRVRIPDPEALTREALS